MCTGTGSHGFMSKERREISRMVRQSKFIKGYISLGEKTITIQSLEYKYRGDLDKKGRACGFGRAEMVNRYDSYAGTFFKDKLHGFSKRFCVLILV